ncbi:non-ribosomal peptide synthetase, partial [Planctobacterium marinum]
VANQYVAPRTDTEKLLCEIWSEVLGVDQVGVEDNFFALGGHSLLLVNVATQLSERLHIKLKVNTLFELQTVAKLASYCDEEQFSMVPDIVAVEDKQSLPLSFSQQRLWLLSQIEQNNAHYNIPGAFRLKGAIDMAALQLAFDTILARHEVLRSVIKADASGLPFQEILPQQALPISVVDLSGLEQATQTLTIQEYIQEELTSGFDLSSSLMLRVKVLRLSDSDHVLIANMHHIASDGWSLGVMMREFSQLYQAFTLGQGNPLTDLAIQYSDYAHWQREQLQGEELQRHLDYWHSQLSGIPQVHSLPLDYIRPKQQNFFGDTIESTLKGISVEKLKKLCQVHDATLFMGLQAVFSVLLARYSSDTDIVTGTPVANREQAELTGLIGFFVNTLVLRNDLSDAPSFEIMLQRTRDMLLQAYSHQQVPFEQVVEHLQPTRDMSYSPLFQVMLVLQNQEDADISLPGLELEVVSQDTLSSKFDITLSVIEAQNSLTLQWNYNTELFKPETIERLAAHFNQLLEALVSAPEKDVFAIEMLSESERGKLLSQAHGEQKSYDLQSSVLQQFESQAAISPNATAVVLGDDTLSYGELNERANQLAHYLINECRVTSESLVGICLPRSLDMMVAILAVFKAGGAYVPLDPTYPESRIRYILEDASVKTLIFTSDVETNLTLADTDNRVCLDSVDLQAKVLQQSNQNPGVKLSPTNLAYIIYTSGSTGNPKGVMVEHGNITRLFLSASERFNFNNQDTWTLFHSFAFDFSVWEIWGALCYGAKLVLVPHWVARSSEEFYQLLSDEKVTVLNQTPSAFSGVIAEDKRRPLPLALRYVIFGGEALNPMMLHDWAARHGDAKPELINMYGITETTVHVTYRRLTIEDIKNSAGISVIGKPLADLGAVILDTSGNLTPPGVAGELYVFGDGVSRCYLNRQQLTAERFVNLSVLGGRRAYRTGDVARYLANGELEYLGRMDSQVQLRGFRIELGEIQHALLAQTSVSDAVVLVQTDGEHDSRLVAWVVGQSATDDWQRQLEEALAQILPEYMVPRAWVALDKLPLTVNGKVDYKALPAPDFSQQQRIYVAPSTEIEQILCDIWQEMLGIEQVGVDDNFFALGGHSLLVMKLITRINEAFSIELPAKELFKNATIKELSVVVEQADRAIIAAPILNLKETATELEDITELEL